MATTITRTRRIIAASGALALGMGLLMGGTAFAEDPNFGDIKTTAQGSITIHKHEHQSGLPTQTGKPAGESTIATPGVKDVTFTAYKVQLDLTKSTDWDKLAKIAPKIPLNACTTGNLGESVTADIGSAVKSGTTQANGETKLAELPVAAYLVCETSAPATVVDKAAPFVVTIPYPDNISSQGKWLYDVHVYPKNAVQKAPTKAVDAPNGFGLGATVEFPVTVQIPNLAENSYYKYLWVKDELDSRLSAVDAPKVTLNDVLMTKADDYTVETQGNTVTVKLTAAGLSKAKQNKGSNLVVTFSGKVTGAVADGNIKNIAQVASDTKLIDTPPPTPPQPEDPPVPPYVPTNKVVTAWGDVKVNKVDANEQTTGLSGAKFQVYEAKNPYADSCTNEKADNAQPISVLVNGQSVNEFTSQNGVVTIPGLYIDKKVLPADVQPDAEVTEHVKRCYVLVETQAPTGYTMPAEPATALTVKVGTTEVAQAYDAKITNTKQSVPQLPMTGANGQVLMIVIGSALVLFAVGSALVSRRRAARKTDQ